MGYVAIGNGCDVLGVGYRMEWMKRRRRVAIVHLEVACGLNVRAGKHQRGVKIEDVCVLVHVVFAIYAYRAGHEYVTRCEEARHTAFLLCMCFDVAVRDHGSV